MSPLTKVFILFWGVVIVVAILTGCGRPIECIKPAIQIANMSNNYKHCKGLEYE